MDVRVRHFCGAMVGVAFLRVDDVGCGVNILRAVCPVELRELFKYFDRTYVSSRTALFTPEIWNVYKATVSNEPRTTISVKCGTIV
jgi:hypothetical protein